MDIQQFKKIAMPITLSRKSYNKVFGIGDNKTGTTTLAAVLQLYGLAMPMQQEQEIRLTHQVFSTNYFEFQRFVERYDAFQDLPFSQGDVYVAADALFPSSKFVLTERDSSEWFQSMCRFHSKIFKIEDLNKLTEKDVRSSFNYLYSGYMYEYKRRCLAEFNGETGKIRWDKLYDKDYYIQQYEQRNQKIKKYFMNATEKLLVIDITKEKTTAKICKFLGIPDELVIDMPHLNKT